MNRFASHSDNAGLIAAARDLGHVRGRTLDATFGYGAWWPHLSHRARTERIAMDIDPAKARRSRMGVRGDFCRPPFRPGSFDSILYDPPFKLNGTPTLDREGPDERYGVHEVATWQARMALILDGIDGLAPLLAPGGTLLTKCMIQVSSGQVRHQPFYVMQRALGAGLIFVDQLDMAIKVRPQPEGRRSVHAASNYSSLLIFRAPHLSPRRAGTPRP